jgi:hypothetical protein
MSASDSVSARPRLAAATYDRLAGGAGLFVVAAAGFVSVLITHLIDFGADDLRISVLDAGSSSSWSHGVIAAMLAAATAVAVIGASRSETHPTLWGVAAGILGFLTVDELSSLHAQIDQISWGKAIYAPILLALAVCLWMVDDRSSHTVALRAGLATLFVSFAIHVFGPHVVHALGWGDNTWADQIKIGLKQGTELAGWLLVLGGLCAVAFRPRALPLARRSSASQHRGHRGDAK